MNTNIPRGRRELVKRVLRACVVCGWAAIATASDVDRRIQGLLVGTAIGDALGGPIEFQDPAAIRRLPNPPATWRDEDVFDGGARAAARGRLTLRRYDDLRPKPESYAHWNTNAPPGTITDDTRHKLILLHALHRSDREGSWPLDVSAYAKAHLDWDASPFVAGRKDYAALASDWLEEWRFAARWILGERRIDRARPPERMWQGLPTCCGQMSLLPLAALYPGEPERAYRAAYHLAFFDNGFGKDLNASLVAGLAAALTVPVEPTTPERSWRLVVATLRSTDPYRHSEIRWSTRSVHRWLDLAQKYATEADRRPARLFAALEREFARTIKWEAQVPFVVAFSCLAFAEYDARAALQLALEWGHDSDSYAQVIGAFAGAIHGPEFFPAEWRDAVTDRLKADFGCDLAAEARFLADLRRRAPERDWVGETEASPKP